MGLDGTGYPPGFLYLLAIEKVALDTFGGDEITPAQDYFLVGRVVNGFIGALCIVLLALLLRQMTKSRLVAWSGALMMAMFYPVIVAYSRREVPTVPGLFFILLTLLFTVQIRHRSQIRYLYLAFGAGILAFLFKYQAAITLVLPGLVALIYLPSQKLYRHFSILGVVLLGLLTWLILDYQMFNAFQVAQFNTSRPLGLVYADGNPGIWNSVTENWKLLSAVAGSELDGATEGVSEGNNRPLIAELIDGRWIISAAIISCPLAIYVWWYKRDRELIDAPSIFIVFAFVLLFYLMMSIFLPTHSFRWIVPAVFILGGVVLMTKASQHWLDVYAKSWGRPHSYQSVAAYLDAYVPQGGRVVSREGKTAFTNMFADAVFHVYTPGDIFAEGIDDYRQRGYEYIIFEAQDLMENDRLQADPESSLELVLDLSGDEFWGPKILMYRIDPLPVHEVYADFGNAISFRGYDLAADRFSAGESLQLTLYWMSIQTNQANLIVFVHVWDTEAQQLISQFDGVPGEGFNNTWRWLGDMQFHPDPYIVPIPSNVIPGDYELPIGMYYADTGQRMAIAPQSDLEVENASLLLQTIVVEP